MIPKSENSDAFLREEFLPLAIPLNSLRMTVLRTIQLDSELRIGAIEIQNVISDCVLPTKFETGESSPSQSPPEHLFVVRLVAAQLAREWSEAHGEIMVAVKKTSSIPSF